MLDTLLTGPGKHFTRAITTYHVTRTWVTTLHEWTNLDRRIVANSQSPPSKCCWYSNLRKKFERTMASVTVRSKNFLPPRLAVEKVWFSRNLSETGYEITESCRNSQSCCVITSLFDTNRDNFEVSVKFFIQKHSAIFRTASASLSNTGERERACKWPMRVLASLSLGFGNRNAVFQCADHVFYNVPNKVRTWLIKVQKMPRVMTIVQ